MKSTIYEPHPNIIDFAKERQIAEISRTFSPWAVQEFRGGLELMRQSLAPIQSKKAYQPRVIL